MLTFTGLRELLRVQAVYSLYSRLFTQLCDEQGTNAGHVPISSETFLELLMRLGASPNGVADAMIKTELETDVVFN